MYSTKSDSLVDSLIIIFSILYFLFGSTSTLIFVTASAPHLLHFVNVNNKITYSENKNPKQVKMIDINSYSCGDYI